MGLMVIKSRQHSLTREELDNQKKIALFGYLQFIMTVVTARHANPNSLFLWDTI